MFMNEGELLKEWVKSKGYQGKEVADMLGLTSRQAIYEVYKMVVLSNKHKEALQKFGFSIKNVKKLSDSESYKDQTIIVKDLEIAHLKQINNMLKDEIDYLKKILAPKIDIKVKQKS